jgi:phosphoheptose isomerase
MTDLTATVDLTSKLVGSYCEELRHAALDSAGCDPMSRGGHARQFFLGNGGCWSIGYVVADGLRSKLSLDQVPRAWHPHEISGSMTTGGLASSFVRLLEGDGLGEADLVHLISGSGRSANLVNVAELTRKCGASVLAHCGHDGGPLRIGVPEGIQVNSFDQQVVEDALLLRLWPGRGEDRDFIAVAVGALTTTLRTEVSNLAAVATAIVQAVDHQVPIGVVAADVATVSASAEHVAHNLSWDMCWDAPEPRPQVHFALSTGLLTAVANDSGADSEPFEHLLRPARSRGMVLNLGRGRTRPPTDAAESDAGISPAVFDSLAAAASPLVAEPQDEEFLRAAFVQLWGHLLIRLGRTLSRTRALPVDDTARFHYARRPIAPRRDRDD